MNVPETVLVPYKNPVDNARWAYTSASYNREFDLDAVAESLGYPLFMKPFDGGGWRGVSMIRDREALHQAYDDSGEMLMHLQQSVAGYDVFARALTIGPETMVMDFRPDEPMHRRYAVSHDFLSPQVGAEAVTIAQTVNAFFRWEFNSCEMLVRDGVVYPIDYANACPDVAVTSLHYYFPWAIASLLKWSAFCLVTGRKARTQVDTDPWFAVADNQGLDYCGEAQGVPASFGRALRPGALPGVLPPLPAARRRDGAGLGAVPGVRPDAGEHRRDDLPRARARAVPRPLPRPDRPVGGRRVRPAGGLTGARPRKAGPGRRPGNPVRDDTPTGILGP